MMRFPAPPPAGVRSTSRVRAPRTAQLAPVTRIDALRRAELRLYDNRLVLEAPTPAGLPQGRQDLGPRQGPAALRRRRLFQECHAAGCGQFLAEGGQRAWVELAQGIAELVDLS